MMHLNYLDGQIALFGAKINKKTILVIIATLIALMAVVQLSHFLNKNRLQDDNFDQSKEESEISVVEDFDEFYNQKVEIGDNVEKNESADLNNDGIKEEYSLRLGRIVVKEESEIIWESPEDWWIDNFVIADSTHDGILDLNLSLWKNGNYGPAMPFWVKENDMSIKNHFFVYGFVNENFQAQWGSSNLPAPNCYFDFYDANDDGKSDLVVVEGEYSDKPDCKGNYLAVWTWNGWGFANEWRSEEGIYGKDDLVDVSF